MTEYNTPLYGYATICLSIHLLMNICAFIFRLLRKCWYEHLCRSICLNICFNSFGCISMRRIAGSYGNSIFNFWETVKLLTSGWITLHSHEQCIWVLISSNPYNQPTFKIYKIKLHYTIRHRVNIYLSQTLSLGFTFINTRKASQKKERKIAAISSMSKLKDASNKMG